jgi:hypothetical protein
MHSEDAIFSARIVYKKPVMSITSWKGIIQTSPSLSQSSLLPTANQNSHSTFPALPETFITMRFSILNSVVAALAVCSSAVAQLTPAQAVDNIRSLTTKSQALQAPAQSITIVNGPLVVIGLGPFPVRTWPF